MTEILRPQDILEQSRATQWEGKIEGIDTTVSLTHPDNPHTAALEIIHKHLPAELHISKDNEFFSRVMFNIGRNAEQLRNLNRFYGNELVEADDFAHKPNSFAITYTGDSYKYWVNIDPEATAHSVRSKIGPTAPHEAFLRVYSDFLNITYWKQQGVLVQKYLDEKQVSDFTTEHLKAYYAENLAHLERLGKTYSTIGIAGLSFFISSLFNDIPAGAIDYTVLGASLTAGAAAIHTHRHRKHYQKTKEPVQLRTDGLVSDYTTEFLSSEGQKYFARRPITVECPAIKPKESPFTFFEDMWE